MRADCVRGRHPHTGRRKRQDRAIEDRAGNSHTCFQLVLQEKAGIVGRENGNAPVEGKIGCGKASNHQNKREKYSKATSDKYLGVHFDSDLKINKHIQETTQKSINLFNSLAKVAKARWGLGQAAMRTLYKGLFEPIITYAAAGWCDLLKGKTKTMLLRTQRMALLQVTEAYRTTSTEALQIIAGVMPIDLLIEVRA
jgi:hypothetical protein